MLLINKGGLKPGVSKAVHKEGNKERISSSKVND
jgi:hypothetical protein